jgi:hypothetical protein
MCEPNLLTPCQICNRARQFGASHAMTLGCAYTPDKLSCVMHSTVSLPPSGSDLHPATGKTALSLRRAYRHCKQYQGRAVITLRVRCRESGIGIREAGLLNISGRLHARPDNLRRFTHTIPTQLFIIHARHFDAASPCQSGRAVAPRFVSDISSPVHVRRCRA